MAARSCKKTFYLVGYFQGETFTPAAESDGLWPWMNAPALGRDVAPLGRSLGATGFARGAPQIVRSCILGFGPDPQRGFFFATLSLCTGIILQRSGLLSG
jgi:hypothetical protein